MLAGVLLVVMLISAGFGFYFGLGPDRDDGENGNRPGSSQAQQSGSREDGENRQEEGNNRYDGNDRYEREDPAGEDVPDNDWNPPDQTRPGETEEPEVKPPLDPRTILVNWYFSEFDRTNIEIAVLADVTWDGVVELITVVRNQEEFAVEGRVFWVDDKGNVRQLEEVRGSEVHAGGFFGWYLKKWEGGYTLAQETFGMWQGYGEVNVTEYILNTDGSWMILNYAEAVSGSEAPVTDEAWDSYVQEGKALLYQASSLYHSATNVGPELVPVEESIILERAEDRTHTPSSDDLVGSWYYYEKRQSGETPWISYLYFYEDGTVHLGVGLYATDIGDGFGGTWTLADSGENTYILLLDGTGGSYSTGSESVEQAFSATIRVTVYGDYLRIDNLDGDSPYWFDGKWYQRDLDYFHWLDSAGRD